MGGTMLGDCKYGTENRVSTSGPDWLESYSMTPKMESAFVDE